MGKFRHELILTNVTFEILSGAVGKISITDPLSKVNVTDGTYTVKLGALTDAQLAELRAFCDIASIHVSNISSIGDSYHTAVIAISINSFVRDELFVIPDRTQNPYVTVTLWHVLSPESPDKISVRLASIKPYTPGEDEMRSIICELEKALADETETPVVTAKQSDVSDRVTLHGVILRKVVRMDSDVVEFTFDNVSNEDLDAIVKLYKDHPLKNCLFERIEPTSKPVGYMKNLVTLVICGGDTTINSMRTSIGRPIDITIELRCMIKPVIYDFNVLEAKQQESDHVTLHGAILRKVKRVDSDVSDFTFGNVSNEDLKALLKLYDARPISDQSERRQAHYDNTAVTIGIFVGRYGFDPRIAAGIPYDITLELNRGQINPTIYDVTRVNDEQPIDSKVNSNTKKEENKMQVTIENVFFNGYATIIMWSDGTKTVVKPIPGDKFDPEMGIAMAFTRKFFGSRHQFEKFTANAFRESYARDVKALTEKELMSLLQDNENTIASAKAKHDAVHQAYEKAVQEGSKKLPKLYGLKSDPDYRYASIRVSVIKAELESRKAKKAAKAAVTKKKRTTKTSTKKK